MVVNKRRWDLEEIDLLNVLYPKVASCDEFQSRHMPHRTANQIYKKAKRLGIHRGKKWSEVDRFDNISQEYLAYFAGILDGEGYIGIEPRSGINIQVTNTSKALIDWLQETFGGSVSYRPQTKPKYSDQWKWALTRKENVLSLLAKVEALLIVKKEKTDYLLGKYTFCGGNSNE